MSSISSRHSRRRYRTVLPTLLLAALAAFESAPAEPLPGQPAVQLDFPVTSPGIPAYARLELLIPGYDLPSDSRWAAVVFYRDPACVPVDFNLGAFFDPPGPEGLGAFACPLLIEGHEIWTNGPEVDLAPRYVRSKNAVPDLPIWFVARRELDPLLATGHVTVTDLGNLPSLVVGKARSYTEQLYPNGAAENPGISLRAEGNLEDGGRFFLSWNYAEFGELDEARIFLSRPVRRRD